MLHSTERAWLHGAGLIGFAKPYRGEKYDFVAVLPEDEAAPLSSVFPSLTVWKELYQTAENVKTEVIQPEFSFDFALEMNAVFQSLGIRSVFSPAEADLSRMTPVPGSYVERILHKTHIENDRVGTKAAAVTAAMVRLGCIPHFEETRFVTLDRPFAFAIFHRETATPLFVGVVNRIQ
jgi:serpin B